MNWERITDRVAETLSRAGIGPKEPHLQLYDEGGEMIGDDIPLTSDIIPKNGEWIGRTVDNKPELFEVCDGFYYLFGGRLVRYINARRSKKEAMVDYFVVFIASDGTSEEAQEAMVGTEIPRVGELIRRKGKNYRVNERLFVSQRPRRLSPVLKAIEQLPP